MGPHLTEGLDDEEAALSLLLLLALILSRDNLRADGDPRSRWRALLVGAQPLLVDMVIGTTLVATAPARIVTGHPDVSATLATVGHGLLGSSGR